MKPANKLRKKQRRRAELQKDLDDQLPVELDDEVEDFRPKREYVVVVRPVVKESDRRREDNSRAEDPIVDGVCHFYSLGKNGQ